MTVQLIRHPVLPGLSAFGSGGLETRPTPDAGRPRPGRRRRLGPATGHDLPRRASQRSHGLADYRGTIRPVPVWLVGPTALRLLSFLYREEWLFETPTRPLGFLAPIASAAVFAIKLHALADTSKEEG